MSIETIWLTDLVLFLSFRKDHSHKSTFICYLLLKQRELKRMNPFRVVLGWAYRGLTGGFLLLQNFRVAISVSPHVCFILVLILISMFLR